MTKYILIILSLFAYSFAFDFSKCFDKTSKSFYSIEDKKAVAISKDMAILSSNTKPTETTNFNIINYNP
ncbi:MAG: hypothetical protein HXX81_01635, partial [Campylobacterales bacterium]|nr:hypothetical protein [Campylobacterales bacterium]